MPLGKVKAHSNFLNLLSYPCRIFVSRIHSSRTLFPFFSTKSYTHDALDRHTPTHLRTQAHQTSPSRFHLPLNFQLPLPHLQEFRNEVMSMAACRHRHLVSLEGCCASERHCILVYEYMEQGSLDDHLYEPREGSTPLESRSVARFLDWPMRLKIALGTARGLAYLHEVGTEQ